MRGEGDESKGLGRRIPSFIAHSQSSSGVECGDDETWVCGSLSSEEVHLKGYVLRQANFCIPFEFLELYESKDACSGQIRRSTMKAA